MGPWRQAEIHYSPLAQRSLKAKSKQAVVAVLAYRLDFQVLRICPKRECGRWGAQEKMVHSLISTWRRRNREGAEKVWKTARALRLGPTPSVPILNQLQSPALWEKLWRSPSALPARISRAALSSPSRRHSMRHPRYMSETFSISTTTFQTLSKPASFVFLY